MQGGDHGLPASSYSSMPLEISGDMDSQKKPSIKWLMLPHCYAGCLARPYGVGMQAWNTQGNIDKRINRMKRWGFLPDDAADSANLVHKADSALFRAMCNSPHHVLPNLFIAEKQSRYQLRARTRNLTLLNIWDDHIYCPLYSYIRTHWNDHSLMWHVYVCL